MPSGAVVFFSEWSKKQRNIWTEPQLIWVRYRVLKSYLTLHDILALDTAICNAELRNEMKCMYPRLQCKGLDIHLYTSIESIRWVTSRGISLREFTLVLPEHEGDATWPTFHYVCSVEKYRDVALLMAKYGADDVVNSRDAGPGFTALHYACKGGNVQMAKMLVEQGHADVNARNGGGYTPLLVICVSGSSQNSTTTSSPASSSSDKDSDKMAIVKLLLQNEANLELQQGVSHFTPLHWCCHVGNVMVAKMLIAAGADITAKTLHNKSPLDLASKALTNKISMRGLLEREMKKRGLCA